MSDITFINGVRVYTPQKPASKDAPFTLTDLNNDGIIDILDAAEYLANGPGGIITTVPPPTIDPPKTCPEGQELTIIQISPGITTTGCNSIPTRPPIPAIGQDPFFCPPGKVRGFGIDYDNPITLPGSMISSPRTVYPFKLFGCVCPEASVNPVEIGVLVATAAWAVSRKIIKEWIEQALIQANKYKDEINDALRAAFKRQGELDLEVARFAKKYEDIQLEIDDFDPTFQSPTVLKSLRVDLANAFEWKAAAANNRMSNNVIINNLTKTVDLAVARVNDLLKSLNDLLTITDPTAIATLLLGGLFPINFIVPKDCGSYSTLDENCNCVPISSGSAFSSYTNMYMPDGYLIIESL